MHIRSLQGKRVCILGLGKEGQATLKALEKYAPGSSITIADKNKELRIKNYESQCGEHYLKNIDRFDVVIKSPGIPPSELQKATYNLKPKTYHLTSATQIFLDTIVDTGATVIGVTGSKGKSTTASLIAAILRAGGKDIDLIGNIGVPVLDFLENSYSNKFFVQEMSSYQLRDLTVSPQIAVITSFFPEHLDYHGSLEAYKNAKSHITRFQKPGDRVVFPAASKDARDIAAEGQGKKIPVSPDDAPIELKETRLIGTHNLSNIALAWKTAEILGVNRATAVQAIKEFHPLPHRLQSLGVHHGIEWIDDAISTTPESTIAAIDALSSRVTTIILGGLDRGYDFTELAKCIAHSSIRAIILFPGSGPRIRTALEATSTHLQFFEAGSTEEAVSIAKKTTSNEQRANKLTSYAPIVLLSTASPSYNMFKNFEEKGDRFQKAITCTRVSPISLFLVFKRVLGVLLIILGIAALVTPLTPGAWFIFVGMELLGISFLIPKGLRKYWVHARAWISGKGYPVPQLPAQPSPLQDAAPCHERGTPAPGPRELSPPPQEQ